MLSFIIVIKMKKNVIIIYAKLSENAEVYFLLVNVTCFCAPVQQLESDQQEIHTVILSLQTTCTLVTLFTKKEEFILIKKYVC